MALSDFPIGAVVAVSDMARAAQFYEGALALTPGPDDGDGGRTYTCGGGTTLHIFPSQAVDGSGSTRAGWRVTDLEKVVEELTAQGVVFEQYDQPPIKTDARGVAVIGDTRAAWFRDPDGNTFGLVER